MGKSVFNQVDNSKYFSLSSVDKRYLKDMGINLPMTKFKEIVRASPPHTTIWTGSDLLTGRTRTTKIYRYEDFAYLGKTQTEVIDVKEVS